MTLNCMLGGILVEVVVDGIAPLADGLLSLEQRNEALALNVRRYLHTSHFQEGGSIVDVLHHVGNLATTLITIGKAHQQGGGKTLLVHETLVEPSVLAHIETLVGGIDNECVLQHTILTKICHETTYVVVQSACHLGIVAHIALILPLHQVLALKVLTLEIARKTIVESPVLLLQLGFEALDIVDIGSGEACLVAWEICLGVVGQVHVVIGGNCHFLLLGGNTTLVGVPEVVGLLEGLVLILAEILQFGQPVAVACLVVHEEDEGAFLVAILHPADGLVGDDVGAISLFHRLASVLMMEERIVVFALTDEDVPVVETSGFADQMPLANECGLIACLLKQFGHGLLGTVEDTVLVVGETIDVAVLTCEHAGTTGPRKTVGHETVAEEHTLLGNLVEIGSLDVALAIGTECLSRVVVSHNVDDVGTLALCLSRKGRHSSHGKN